MKKPETFMMPLTALQPSQLYINQEKLEAVRSRIDFSDIEMIPPIPVQSLDGRLVMTDGHTRAFAAHLAGLKMVPITYEQDDLDWEAYRICVGWCRDAGITTIAELQNRVVDPGDYQILWLDRCKKMQEGLARKEKI